MKSKFKNKKVLLIGLGILGGGVTTANWLLKQGAKLSITDSKPKEFFKDSIKKIKGKVNYFFENCDEKNIVDADIVVINQAVPKNNPLVLLAEKLGKTIYNEARIFYENCPKPIIAITGTRGKTTVTNWTAHLIGGKSIIAGNSSTQPPLEILPKTKNKKYKIVVNEIPSFQLERFDSVPCIALITNIFVDHLNRHGTLENYALAKANIFKNQTKNNKLILNFDNEWTNFFLKQNPKAEIWFFSLNKLPENKNGIYYQDGNVFLQTETNKPEKILEIKDFNEIWGKHNVANLLSSVLAAYLSGEKFSDIQKRIKTIPQVKYRQEIVANLKNTKIINDTSATSPEGGMAAIERFGSKNCILIAGGTDAGLEYKDWAKTAIKYLPLENIVLLNGSATKKILVELEKITDISNISVKDSLEECVKLANEKIKDLKENPTMLFSPSAKSFEKFKNEFDRGEKFNALIKKLK
jgi:UDP-N-acetylmuramoylalanine--D-glutamate ligase